MIHVVGAGIAGLASALALRAAGLPVCVVERAAAPCVRGGGIGLTPNGMHALHRLGLGAEVCARSVVQAEGGVRTPGGRWLARTDLGFVGRRYGEHVRALLRRDLLAVLVAALPPETVRYGLTATLVAPGGPDEPALLRVGADIVASDLVIAADGIRSSVRATLYPDHPGLRDCGCASWRTVVPAADLTALPAETWGRGLRLSVLPLPAGRVHFSALATDAVRGSADLVTLYGDWHDPIPTLLARAADAEVHVDRIEELAAPLPGFSHGRVVLVGDAAHPMAPNVGLANIALEDAVELVHRVRDVTDFSRTARRAHRLRPHAPATRRAAGQDLPLDRPCRRGGGPGSGRRAERGHVAGWPAAGGGVPPVAGHTGRLVTATRGRCSTLLIASRPPGRVPLCHNRTPRCHGTSMDTRELELRIGQTIIDGYRADTARGTVFELLGRRWDLLDDVWPPAYSPGGELHADLIPFGAMASFLEMGSGTGVMSVLAALAGCRRVLALDLNPAAVENTVRNARRHGVADRVEARTSDLYAAVAPGERFDGIYWNPPFLDAPAERLDGSLWHETMFDPGYAKLRRFLVQGADLLTPAGRIYLWFGEALGRPTLIGELASGAGLAVRELHRKTMAEVPAALVGVLPADVTSGDRHAQWHLHLLELERTT